MTSPAALLQHPALSSFTPSHQTQGTSVFLFPFCTHCRTQLHIRASRTRGPLWDTEPTAGPYSLPCKAEPESPFTTICSTCFGEVLSRTQARAQEVSSTFGDLLYTGPYAEMSPLRKYRLWKARNVRKGM